MEDEEIIELYLKRDENAILHTQKKYGTTCQKISQNIVGNREDAQECVNDSYLKVWNSIPPNHPNLLSAFLYRIVRNLSLDRYRFNHAGKRSHGVDVLYSELEECLPDLSAETGTDEGITAALNAFLATQDEKTRLLFVRRYWYMDSNETLAALFSISENSVRQRLCRTREKLREYLKKEGIGL